MNQATNVNVVPSYGQRGELHFSQYDVGRTATINLYGVNEAFSIPASSTVKIQATKPSGLGFNESCTYSGNVVTIVCTATMTEEWGRFPCELQITKDSDIIGTANFMFCVEPSPHPDGTVDGDSEAIVNEIEALVLQSEGYALGTQNGVPVDSSSVYYHNNAKWLSDNAVLSDEVKQALLNCFEKVAWIDANGQTYYNALQTALNRGAELLSISAVYTQSGTVYDTDSLDDLKPDLVVTGTYDGGETETILAYTLSGSLTVGTSTITVSYGGKTTTFNVTVTENRYIPTQYTWLYDAKDGTLLSDENYVTLTTGGSGGTETIVDDELVLNSSVAPSGTNYLKYAFSDTTTTNAKVSYRAKPVYCPLDSQNSVTGFRLQLSNGTGGAQAYIQDGDNNKIAICYFEGSTRKSIITNYLLNEFHVFELELSNGHQKFSIDGSEIFDKTTLSTNYCTANAMYNQASNSTANPNGVVTNIDWISYYEV